MARVEPSGEEARGLRGKSYGMMGEWEYPMIVGECVSERRETKVSRTSAWSWPHVPPRGWAHAREPTLLSHVTLLFLFHFGSTIIIIRLSASSFNYSKKKKNNKNKESNYEYVYSNWGI